MLVRLPDNELRPVQGYHVPEELLLKRLAELGAAPMTAYDRLSDSEKELLTWVLAKNGGYMTGRDLQEQLGLSPYQAHQRLQEWRLKDWVEKDAHNNNAHRVQVEAVRPWLAGESA